MAANNLFLSSVWAIYCLYLSKMLTICEESWWSLQIRVYMFIFFHPKFFSVVLLTWVSILSWRSLLNFGIFSYILLLFSLKMLYICKGKMILVKKCIIQQRSSRLSRSPKMTKRRSWWSFLDFGFFGYILLFFQLKCYKYAKERWY